jgi:RHS repeat-associated protein
MTSDGLLSGANKFAYTARDQLSSITPHGESAKQVVSHGTGQVDRAAIGSEEVLTNVLGVGVTGTGESAKYYTRGSEGTLFAKRTAKGKPSETEYFTLEPFGSVAILTSSTGAQTAPPSGAYQYDPYGASLGAAPATFGFESGQVLPGGALHFGARYYAPALGQWTQPEPLEESGTFAYSGDNPINLADPTGLHPADCWEAAGHVFRCHPGPSGGPTCLVSFAGHISTCSQLLARAKAIYHEEYESNKKTAETFAELIDVVKCVVEKGNCPTFGAPG